MASHLFEKIIERHCENKVVYILTFSNFYNYHKTDTRRYGIHRKFALFKKHVLENAFLNEYERNTCVFIFSYFQRVLLALERFKHVYRLYKCKKFDVDTDLSLTPLSEYRPEQIITILENKTVYRFALIDLLRIFNTSLMSNEYMVSKPRHPRNPYTNLRFTRHNVYNIYYALKFGTRYNIKSHIHSYIEECTNLKTYYEKNSFILKSASVVDFIRTQDTNTLYRYACDMFYDYRNYTSIDIAEHADNKEAIVENAKRLLYYYLFLQQFSTDDETFLRYEGIFVRYLKKFTREHPYFGRRYYRVRRRERRLVYDLNNTVIQPEQQQVEQPVEQEQQAAEQHASEQEQPEQPESAEQEQPEQQEENDIVHNTIFPRELIERYNQLGRTFNIQNTDSENIVTHYEIDPRYENNALSRLISNNPFSNTNNNTNSNNTTIDNDASNNIQDNDFNITVSLLGLTQEQEEVLHQLESSNPELASGLISIQHWANSVLENEGSNNMIHDEDSDSVVTYTGGYVSSEDEDGYDEEHDINNPLMSLYADEMFECFSEDDLDEVD